MGPLSLISQGLASFIAFEKCLNYHYGTKVQSSLLYSSTVTTDDSMSHKQTNTDIFDSGSDIDNVAFRGVTIYFSVSSFVVLFCQHKDN